MHNSGTSLAGALLHAAGVPMGDHLLMRETIEPSRRPSYDYFEDEEVVALQDAYLLRLQRHWSSYRAAFPLPEPSTTDRAAFRSALAALVRRRLRKQRLWVVKDPRTAVLLSDWLKVLAELGITGKLLIVHRDPASNIRSFSRKGQVPALWAEALWQRTYANALDAAQALPRERVDWMRFQNLLASPVAEARRACAFLGLAPTPNLEQRISSCFDASLPTEKVRANESAQLQPVTEQLATLLESGTLGEGRPAEPSLLGSQMEKALAHQQPPVQLNSLNRDGQTLLPKAGVRIVTAEFQGWGPSGGIGSAYLELSQALASAGHPVKVLLVSEAFQPPPALHPVIDVHHLNPQGISRLRLCRAVADWLRNDPGDVIHLHDWLGLGSGLKAALGSNAPPLIVGLHGPSSWARSGNPWPRGSDGGLASPPEHLMYEGLIQALEQDLIEEADHLVAPSSFMAEWVSTTLLGGEPQRLTLVQRNCPLSEGRIQAKANCTPNQQILIYFGRLEERKGLLLFLAALQLMQRKPTTVIFVGGDCLISETRQGSAMARESLAELGISTRFLTTLTRDEALRTLEELQGIVVIPSLIENSPCALEELLDSGLKVVATNVGGAGEMVASPCEQWLAAPDATDLAKHLDAALTSSDPEAYRLAARVSGWQIALSWQAFHERLPRCQPVPTTQHMQPSRIQRGLQMVHRRLKALLSRVHGRTH